MTVLLIILALLLAGYVLALRCRRGNQQLTSLRGWSYAHRGLHGKNVPENSMAAFRLALEGGYGIELDVHLMADGTLAVIHDASLKRTAGADVAIEDLTQEELAQYRLEGTDEQIPLFQDVLELFDGKAPMIIELKAERGNHEALASAVCNLLDDYKGVFCIESFDPRVLYYLRKNRPEICRGQLAENFFADSQVDLKWHLKFILSNLLGNFLTVPDFVAYRFSHRKNPGVYLARKLWGVQGVAWTITSEEDYDTAVLDGWIPIFEGFRP